MRLQMSWVVFALFVPTLAYADDHNADSYLAASGGGGGSTVAGVHQTLAIEIPHWLHNDFAIVPADFSVQFGDRVTQVIYGAGVRYTLADNSGPNGTPRHPHKGLLQVLLGTVYTNDAEANFTNKDFAVTLGFGYEFVQTPRVSYRFMYDRIGRFGDRDEWFDRWSGGVSYRWRRPQ